MYASVSQIAINVAKALYHHVCVQPSLQLKASLAQMVVDINGICCVEIMFHNRRTRNLYEVTNTGGISVVIWLWFSSELGSLVAMDVLNFFQQHCTCALQCFLGVWQGPMQTDIYHI